MTEMAKPSPKKQNASQEKKKEKNVQISSKSALKQSGDDPTNANCPERAKASETPQKLVSSQDEGLPEEICSAKPKCLRPVQTRPDIWQVDWVQCDGKCQLWFHLFCIRLRKDQVNQNNDYFCNECKLDVKNKEVRCFINTMAVRVVEFSNGGYKIRKIFVLESTY